MGLGAKKRRVGFVLNNFDFEPYHQKYGKACKRYTEFYEKMIKLKDFIKVKEVFIMN